MVAVSLKKKKKKEGKKERKKRKKERKEKKNYTIAWRNIVVEVTEVDSTTRCT